MYNELERLKNKLVAGHKSPGVCHAIPMWNEFQKLYAQERQKQLKTVFDSMRATSASAAASSMPAPPSIPNPSRRAVPAMASPGAVRTQLKKGVDMPVRVKLGSRKTLNNLRKSIRKGVNMPVRIKIGSRKQLNNLKKSIRKGVAMPVRIKLGSRKQLMNLKKNIRSGVDMGVRVKLRSRRQLNQLRNRLRWGINMPVGVPGLRAVTGLISKMGPYGAAAAAGIGLIVGSVASVTAALLALGRRAHVIDDLGTSTVLTSREVQQLGRAFVHTTGSYEASQRVAASLADTLTSLSDRYFDVTQRAELLRALNVGPQSLGSLGFDTDEILSGDPRALIDQVRAAVERGVTNQELRIGLGRAGFSREEITELIQGTRTAEAYGRTIAALQTPALDDKALRGFQEFNNTLAGIKVEIAKELTPVLTAIAPTVDKIGRSIADAIPRGIQWIKDFRRENKDLFQAMEAGGYIIKGVAEIVGNTLGAAFRLTVNTAKLLILGIRDLVSYTKIWFHTGRDTIDAMRDKFAGLQLTVLNTAKSIVDSFAPFAKWLGLSGVGDIQESINNRIGELEHNRRVTQERRAATRETIGIERQHIRDNALESAKIVEDSAKTVTKLLRDGFGIVRDTSAAVSDVYTSRSLAGGIAPRPSLGGGFEAGVRAAEGGAGAPMVSITTTNNIEANANLDEVEAMLRRSEERQIRPIQEVLG